MDDRIREQSWLEPLKMPPLANRGFNGRLRDRIMRELEAGRMPQAAKRRWLPFVALLAGIAAVLAVLFAKPDLEPMELVHSVPASPESKVEILQAPKTPAHEWADGFLLGLRTDDPAAGKEAGGRYRTLWIAPQDGRLGLIAEGSGILVPYGMDFWLVYEADFVAGEQLFARKLSSASSANPSQKAVLRGNEDENAEREEILAFAGQSYTVLYRSVEGGKREGLLTDLKSLSTGERNARSLDEIAPLTREQAAEAGTDWFVAREQGRWFIRTANAAAALNGKAAVHDGVCLPWTDIAGAVPDAVDAFCSPGENWIAVLTGDALVALPVDPVGTPGEPVLSVPLRAGETPVLSEWATGAYVEKWTSFITALYAADGDGGSQDRPM
jgi:hypothetical protein